MSIGMIGELPGYVGCPHAVAVGGLHSSRSAEDETLVSSRLLEYELWTD